MDPRGIISSWKKWTFWHHTGDDPTKVSVEARNETGESSCSPASPEQGGWKALTRPQHIPLAESTGLLEFSAASLLGSVASCRMCVTRDFGQPELLGNLTACAEKGCAACRLRNLGILKALRQRDRRVSDPEPPAFVRLAGPAIGLGPEAYDSNRIFLYSRPGEGTFVCPIVGRGQEVAPRRASHISVLKEWLKRCHENHPACVTNLEVPLPTRVLSIGNEDSDRVRLEVARDRTGCYTALSHCWGGGIEIRTIRDNVESREKGLPYSLLPKSFQDAVTVTRHLGLKYLWIDALCIVQDDQDDWERESGNMAAVYQNAYLVLGADMSPNSHGGFLDVGPGGYHGAGTPVAVVESTTVYARSGGPPSLWSSPHPVADEPLSKRAWTLQEQLLAPKMVHFTSKEMVWECNSGEFCECMDMDHAGEIPYPRLSIRDIRLSLSFTSTPDKFKLWYEIVNQVTKRDITMPEDLLPCLSGLAKKFQDSGAGVYLAGLWLDDVQLGLLWRPERPGVPQTSLRATPYRGPTWSWTSIANPKAPYYDITTKLDRKLTKVYAKVVKAECTPKGKDPLGAVSGGYLEVVAPLLEVPPFLSVPGISTFDFHFTRKQGEKQFILIIGELTLGKVEGLILRHRPDVSKNTYERVGRYQSKQYPLPHERELVQGGWKYSRVLLI